MSLTHDILPAAAAVRIARRFLAEAQQADIHDHGRIIESHAALISSLAGLLESLAAEQVTR